MPDNEQLHNVLIGLMIGMPCVGILNSLWFGNELRSYLASSPMISTWQDMERFKRIVSGQMYAALAQIGFLVIPYPAFAIGLYLKVLEPSDVLYILVPSGVLVIAGIVFKRIEERAKHLTVAEEFAAEYDRVIRTWMKKPFPDW